jgi:hypothetical protein
VLSPNRFLLSKAFFVLALAETCLPFIPARTNSRVEACIPSSGGWTERFFAHKNGRMDSQAIKVPRRNKFPEQALREKHVVPVPPYSIEL